MGDFTLSPGLGLLDTERLHTTIAALGGDVAIEDLSMPFAAVATDITTGEAVAITQGSLVEALRASIAVPGLFRPPRIDGKILVDGGLAASLPLEFALKLGAAHVIAVRLVPEMDHPARQSPLDRTSTSSRSTPTSRSFSPSSGRIRRGTCATSRSSSGLAARPRSTCSPTTPS